jgi:hypothetical protein
VRIRLGNLSAMDHHPIHLHGHYFGGGHRRRRSLSAQWPESAARAVGRRATSSSSPTRPATGLHCHMTHHIMNQMGHQFPNMVGMKPGDLDEKIRPLLPAYMTMGHTGMDMGRMAEVMRCRNSIPMKGHGPLRGLHPMGMFRRSSRFGIV